MGDQCQPFYMPALIARRTSRRMERCDAPRNVSIRPYFKSVLPVLLLPWWSSGNRDRRDRG